MSPLLTATRCCAICEACIEHRASNVRYCSKQCRYRKNRLAKIRKFEPERAQRLLERYIEEQKRDATTERGSDDVEAITRKNIEEKCSEGVDLSPGAPKRAQKTPSLGVNTVACSGECPKCGEVWRGSTSCTRCGHGFSAVLF